MKKNIRTIAWGAMSLLLAAPLTAAASSVETATVVEQTAAQALRKIVKVETINVQSPVGTVPRLPFQVWVTYSDGTSEYR